MKAIGFNFTKLNVSKTGELKNIENINIETKMDVLDLKEVKANLLNTKEEVIGVDFEYIVDYKPEFAKVNINGKVLLTLEPKMAKEVIKGWKDKNLPEDFRIFLFNIILRKSTLKALQLEEELNLPLHVPMPSFKKETKN